MSALGVAFVVIIIILILSIGACFGGFLAYDKINQTKEENPV